MENLPLRFERVSFRYPGGEEVLKGIDMEVRPGERIALVGENGAGKTTLIKLMMGLYQPTGGRILLGERPLEEWPQERVRRSLSRSCPSSTGRFLARSWGGRICPRVSGRSWPRPGLWCGRRNS
jgi:ABC-type transport system involved in cytochrome bd biosynthesis fused ATPase/permease subunit